MAKEVNKMPYVTITKTKIKNKGENRPHGTTKPKSKDVRCHVDKYFKDTLEYAIKKQNY